MADVHALPYLCFVRFDLPNKKFDRQFNGHYDAHILEWQTSPATPRPGARRSCAGPTTKA